MEMMSGRRFKYTRMNRIIIILIIESEEKNMLKGRHGKQKMEEKKKSEWAYALHISAVSVYLCHVYT